MEKIYRAPATSKQVDFRMIDREFKEGSPFTLTAYDDAVGHEFMAMAAGDTRPRAREQGARFVRE